MNERLMNERLLEAKDLASQDGVDVFVMRSDDPGTPTEYWLDSSLLQSERYGKVVAYCEPHGEPVVVVDDE